MTCSGVSAFPSISSSSCHSQWKQPAASVLPVQQQQQLEHDWFAKLVAVAKLSKDGRRSSWTCRRQQGLEQQGRALPHGGSRVRGGGVCGGQQGPAERQQKQHQKKPHQQPASEEASPTAMTTATAEHCC